MSGRTSTLLIPHVLLLIALLLSLPTRAAETLDLPLNDQTTINLEVFSAAGSYLYIWQSHEQGIMPIDRQLATRLAEQGIEVWIPELLDSYFLANTASNMDKVSAEAYQAILQRAAKTGKRVILGASGRGAIPVLRGIHAWQGTKADHRQLAGLILLSPKLYVETPQPGETAAFMPIAQATNQPIVLLQPRQSPWFWKLNETMAALNHGGSDIYLQPLAERRDRFYFRPDATVQEQRQGQQLWRAMAQGIRLLSREPARTRQQVALKASVPIRHEQEERRLQPFRGNPTPPALALPQLNGRPLSLNEFHGQVVLVNFWASWCPPCVHEMPSMQRLADKLAAQPFTILAVNMAEPITTVRDFLQNRVQVQFPVVLDKDGRALKDWQVFAFPTSYVIDKQGQIRFALFGSVEWDEPGISQPIIDLINE